MASLNFDGSIKDLNMMEAKSEDSEHYTSENKDKSIVKRYKLKASSMQKEMRYICKECGKQNTTQGNLNAHKRAVHEGIKYPCGQCQHLSTSKGSLARHRRTVHEQIEKFPVIE